MNPFKRWLVGLISLLSVLMVTGCTSYPITGTVVEKEAEDGGYKWNSTKKKWVYKDACKELDIRVDSGTIVERCVSDRVFNDAVVNKKINLTEDYN